MCNFRFACLDGARKKEVYFIINDIAKANERRINKTRKNRNVDLLNAVTFGNLLAKNLWRAIVPN